MQLSLAAICSRLSSSHSNSKPVLFLAAGMLGSDSWPASAEFLDFLKIMDAEEEELMDEEAEKPKEEVTEKEMLRSSPREHSPPKKANVHSEL